MKPDEPDGGPIPAGYPTNESVTTAAGYLAYVFDLKYGTRNGQTALYWAILGTLAKHAKERID